MSASETRFAGVRVRYDSTKSYEELVSALLADIGEQPVPINDIAATNGDWESYRARSRNPRRAKWFHVVRAVRSWRLDQ